MDAAPLNMLIGGAGGMGLIIWLVTTRKQTDRQAEVRSTQFVLAWRDFLLAYSHNPAISHQLRTDLATIAILLPYLWHGMNQGAEPDNIMARNDADIQHRYRLAAACTPEKRVLDLISLATSLIHQNNSPTYQDFSAQCG